MTAALSVYLYGLLAVEIMGATGHDRSDGWTVPAVVADNLGNQAVFNLFALPLMTASIGWAAAAATARLRPGSPAPALASPVPQPAGPGTEPRATPAGATPARATEPGGTQPRATQPRGAAPTARRNRTWYVLLLCAALVAAALLVFLYLAPSR